MSPTNSQKIRNSQKLMSTNVSAFTSPLSPKFQSDWGEILCSSAHNDLPDHRVSRVEDVVPAFAQQGSRLGDPAIHNPHGILGSRELWE